MTSPSLSFSLPLHGKGKKRDAGNEVGLEDRQTATHSLSTLICTPGPRKDWVLKQLVKKHFMYAIQLTQLRRPRHYVVVFCRWVLKVECTKNMTTSMTAMAPSENGIWRFCNHFSIISSQMARQMRTYYPGIKLIWAVWRLE